MSPPFPVQALDKHPILHPGPQKQRSQNFRKMAVQRPPRALTRPCMRKGGGGVLVIRMMEKVGWERRLMRSPGVIGEHGEGSRAQHRQMDARKRPPGGLSHVPAGAVFTNGVGGAALKFVSPPPQLALRVVLMACRMLRHCVALCSALDHFVRRPKRMHGKCIHVLRAPLHSFVGSCVWKIVAMVTTQVGSWATRLSTGGGGQ